MVPALPRSALFPYTTLFRSHAVLVVEVDVVHPQPLQRGIARLAYVRGVAAEAQERDRKSTRLNSSHSQISYAVFCLKKKKEPAADEWQARKRLLQRCYAH